MVKLQQSRVTNLDLVIKHIVDGAVQDGQEGDNHLWDFTNLVAIISVIKLQDGVAFDLSL